MKEKIKLIHKGNQCTIENEISFVGNEMLFGKEIKITLLPSDEDTGIRFLVDDEYIKASAYNCHETDMHITALSENGQIVYVTEHLLSAVYGLKIDNIIIKVEGGNVIPLMDACSHDFTKHLKRAGVKTQSSPKCYIEIVDTFIIKDTESDSFAIFKPKQDREKSCLTIQSAIDFPETIIGTQMNRFEIDEKSYIDEISRARTFFHKPYKTERWQKIKEMYKGVPDNIMECPIIHWDTEYRKDLRFEDEPVRHKILDFLGDISLSNSYIDGEVMLYKPSHKLNRHIAKLLYFESRQ